MVSTVIHEYLAFKYVRKEAAKGNLEMKYWEKHISKAVQKELQQNVTIPEQENSKNWQQAIASSAKSPARNI